MDNEEIPNWSKSYLPGPILTLRNTQVGALHDSLRAWPSSTDLEGFFYKHLGSFDAAYKDDPRNWSVEKWKRWLATDRGLNRDFSPQPYAQLADYFTAAGRREQANSILFAGRERERKEAFRDHCWRRWLWLSTLRWLCGYGIGVQTFWVLPWIVGSVILGAGVLWFGPAHANGPWWCLGASLDRLLPVIELTKGFDDFFDVSKGQLTGGVIAFFSALRLWGWVLGSFLVAAVAGLLQKS